MAAIDLLPDGVAVGLGALFGAALVGAAVVADWPWAAAVGVGLAVLLGRSAGVRPRAVGWGRPAVGAVVLVGLAGGLARVAVMGVGVGGDLDSLPVGADDVEAMRLDLGVAASTSGDESTDASTGTYESTSEATGSTSTTGDDSTGGRRPPKRPPVYPPKPPVVNGEDTTSTAGGDTTSTTGDDTATTTATGEPPDDETTGSETEPKCWDGMVVIEGGDFGEHDIAPFCLDVTEVKVSSYERCVADRRCSKADTGRYCNARKMGRGSHPINCVDWEQAKAFCEKSGKRLPTQWEWEWAARGRDEGRKYPWGKEAPTCARAVMSEGGDGCGKDRTWHVGSRPKGDSRDGVKDMAGNVWEWTSSRQEELRIVRGGSWIYRDPGTFRASIHSVYQPSLRIFHVGFRCARKLGGSK